MAKRPIRESLPMVFGRLLLTLFPGLTIVAGACAFYYKTDFLFSITAWRLSRVGKYYIPAAVLILSAGVLTWLAFRFKRKKPELGNQVFTLYIILPIIAFLVFSEWTSTILLALSLTILAAVSQIPVFRPIALHEDRKRKKTIPGFDILAAFQGTLILILAVAGILLFVGARYWAYGVSKLADVQAKGIYAEVKDVATLVDLPRVEYVKITDPGLKFGHSKTKRFGSGDDAYNVTYAMLMNARESSRRVEDWPLWYYCGDGACSLPKPLYVAVDRCDDATACPNDFLTVLRDIYSEKTGVRYQPMPRGLRLLSEDEDLAYTENVWRAKILWRLIFLAIIQFAYTAIHAALSFKLRTVT